MKILVATNNINKINEIKRIAEATIFNNELIFVSPNELDIKIKPEEIYNTFEENAKLKAIEFYKISKLPTIADDSGLEIEVLDGAPGVKSARFAEEDNDKANREKVLALMKDQDNRNAQFRTVIAFYDGSDTVFFQGECKGRITFEEKGSNGFGYDPIFIPDGYDTTFAEMSSSEKNSISHRYKAVLSFCRSMDKHH
ncbi:dITP/XTP pyrophosphatase [bioreactor metagenome]|uniref:dITP/XTP pyrophosphatase n=1 Tax=bioreactor metagenome TaxID=1076179 RepID=A0A645DD36_9ZZZZ